jgi:excisionase family DNA binding protein
VSDDLTTAVAQALEALIRRLVAEEVRPAEREWRWRTPEQAGELLGISSAAVRQRVARGQLPATKLEGRLYLDVRDLDLAIRNGSYDAARITPNKWAERCCNTPGPDDQGGNP